MLNLISFLTQIPVKKNVQLADVTAKSYLFPVVGSLIGLLVAAVALVVFDVLSETPEIAALISLLALYLVTGLLHLDGIADFFDGVMAPGSREEKRRAMKDNTIGIAGLFAVVLVLLVQFFAIKTVCTNLTATAFGYDLSSFYRLAAVFVIAEVAAKLSMNTCLVLGRGFAHSTEGLGTVFIRSASPLKYAGALLSAVVIALLFTGSFRAVIVFTGVIVAVVVVQIATQKFGAVSGDVVGASNELTRCVTLLLLAIIQIYG